MATLQLLEHQLELGKLLVEFLGTAAEARPTQHRDLQLQMADLLLQRGNGVMPGIECRVTPLELADQLPDQRLERLRIIGKCGRLHGQSVPIQTTDARAFVR